MVKLACSYAVVKTLWHRHCCTVKGLFLLKRATFERNLLHGNVSYNVDSHRHQIPFTIRRGIRCFAAVQSDGTTLSSTKGIRSKVVGTSGNEKASNASKSVRNERDAIKNTKQKVGL